MLKHNAARTHGAVELRLHAFMSSTLNAGEYLLLCCGHFVFENEARMDTKIIFPSLIGVRCTTYLRDPESEAFSLVKFRKTSETGK
jgi:hypothetical protein